MIETDTLKIIKKILYNFSDKYQQMVNTFEQSTAGTEFMEEEKKMNVRMEALEIRCKKSQFLLEDIIAALNNNNKGLIQIKEYENQINSLLTDIRGEINKNNLLEMIKHLEKIPSVMSDINKKIQAHIDKTDKISETLH